ncbi:lactate utilization protein C [uncultured Jatrophihabitans sp.]|uniref:LutC/YkgG family protein n=1 Tax=uncultured Jatrophihabitans sp. TaxID=1610747 RepID=UPI0035C98320
MSAREEMLGRIRTALADRPDPTPVVRAYRGATGAGDIDVFAERVDDYKATVHRDVTTAEILTGRGITRVIVPDGFPSELLPVGIEVVREPVDVATLDAVSAVLTTCRVAVAETGTIVLDAGPGIGPRMLTLVPDYHLVVVRRDQIVAGVPDAVASLEATRPQTWISGPSATSDIELNRVEGVHGPRTLDVVVLTDGGS